MPKAEMRDVVVVLPGITGSVLQHDGKDVWAISGQAAWGLLSNFGGLLETLTVNVLDPDPAKLESIKNLDDLGDGVTATRLMPDLHMIPGLWKIDGYGEVRQLILENFDVIEGQNYLEFPYDWRRDNRIAAHRLKRVLDGRLRSWRASSGARDAKVILVGHSMGGLVSRYYLECLEGWRDCRALITFGTPYRGSVNALNFLSNGFKALFVDLTQIVRSCSSLYQLLPTYRVLRVVNGMNRQDLRLGDPGSRIPKLDPTRVASALAFHAEIDTRVVEHGQDATYLKSMRIASVVGTRQPTLVSAVLDDGQITASETLLDDTAADLSGGDGTVPRISAIPGEQWGTLHAAYFEGRHASLQGMNDPLEHVLNLLLETQNLSLPAQGGKRPLGSGWISLYLDDLYAPGEPVVVRARAFSRDGSAHPVRLEARLRHAGTGPKMIKTLFAGDLDSWQALRVEGLEPGVYRIEVRPQSAGARVRAVRDVFEVVG